MRVMVNNIERELNIDEQLALRALSVGYEHIGRAHGLLLLRFGLARYIGGASGRWKLTDAGREVLRNYPIATAPVGQGDPSCG